MVSMGSSSQNALFPSMLLITIPGHDDQTYASVAVLRATAHVQIGFWFRDLQKNGGSSFWSPFTMSRSKSVTRALSSATFAAIQRVCLSVCDYYSLSVASVGTITHIMGGCLKVGASSRNCIAFTQKKSSKKYHRWYVEETREFGTFSSHLQCNESLCSL